MNETVLDPNSWVNDTIPIPPYLGLDGSQQAGLIAGYFIATVVATFGFILALFNPCKTECKGLAREGGCCPPKEHNWCYLCCSVMALKLYFACCCCRHCCRRGGRWAGKRADTLKEMFQNELEADWEHLQNEGMQSSEEEPDDEKEGSAE